MHVPSITATLALFVALASAAPIPACEARGSLRLAETLRTREEIPLDGAQFYESIESNARIGGFRPPTMGSVDKKKLLAIPKSKRFLTPAPDVDAVPKIRTNP
ncbi:hypothetical protein FA13DRAFT_1797853 [Coprinellus micaceus]|uniref:Uncharacterized protein n=1 Tax=Coprinellus micaceus TaxID=71717 RepID=A0A4Y7SP83_COPMI|nr:hypothetical protein FA13DRAFT_1797853 [Coprinellus micaceus]